METKSKFSRRYDAEFKRSVVALVQSGRTLREVCRDLGCSKWSLGRWVAEQKNGGALCEPKTLKPPISARSDGSSRTMIICAASVIS